jgi:PAS domain S-box-containing protein
VELARRGLPHRFKRTRPDGTILEVVGTPLPEGGFVTTYTDVTDQERAAEALRESEARYRTLFEAVPVAVIIHQDHTIRMANRAAARIFRFGSPERAVGMNVLEFIREDARDLAHRFIADLEEAPEGEVRAAPETAYRTLDGEVVYMETWSARVRYRDRAATLALLLDVTARWKAERALRQMNRELERRVRSRTAELEASNQELESFSYSVSHDLRAPLRALDGFSHLLEDEFGQVLNEEGRAHLKRIRAASQRMGVLIDDLLDLARVSRQELIRVPVDLSALAAEIAVGLREQAPQRAVRFAIAPQLTADADPVLIKLALDNLLRNAWKFTAERAQARIEFGRAFSHGAEAFYVRDNGAGFDMAYAGKLFRPFQRLHDVKRFDGTGIGLATVQRVILRHGGRVWAEGAAEQGATFYFMLG